MKKTLEAFKRAAYRTWLIQKRVALKPIFIAVLLLIVLLSAVYPLLSNGGGSVITVAIYADERDEAVKPVVEDLVGHRGMIVCYTVDSAEAAREAVVNGTADAGWVFLPDLNDRIGRFLSGDDPDDRAIVMCYEKENNVYLNLSRERLFTAMFESVSRAVFVEEMFRVSGAEPTEENIRRYFSESIRKDELIEFRDGSNNLLQKQDYMISPLKGLLAILIFAGGMAAAIMCAKDEHSGIYLAVGRGRALGFKLLEIFIPTLDLGLAVYAALALLGLIAEPGRDALLLFAYVLASAALCFLLAEILRTPVRLSIALLLIILLSIAAAPIFISIGQLRALSYCLPCYHYLVGEYNDDGILYLFLYAAVCFVPALVVNRLYKRR